MSARAGMDADEVLALMNKKGGRPSTDAEVALGAEIERLRCGLRQIIEGDFPADACDAETWAAELLIDSHCVDWAVGDFYA